jgi:hypothetical protein
MKGKSLEVVKKWDIETTFKTLQRKSFGMKDTSIKTTRQLQNLAPSIFVAYAILLTIARHEAKVSSLPINQDPYI